MAWIVGVDEAGRGPWAGPVVAAAVAAPEDHPLLARMADSKRLSPAARTKLWREIRRVFVVRTGWASPEEIDRLNILKATMLAMRRAFVRLPLEPARIYVDGAHLPPGFPPRAVARPKADREIPVVGAASIVAKVVRDRWMRLLDCRYPGYGFAQHKGYGTQVHQEALMRLGPSPVHRRSFAPVRAALNGGRGSA